MKSKIKLTYMFIISFILASFSVVYSQSAGDYRSANSGDWNGGVTWEIYSGSSWGSTATPPNNTYGTITIRSGHTVTITSNVNADQLVVENGGTLTCNNGVTLNIDDGSGNDFVVDGIFNLYGTLNAPNNGETMIINGTMNWGGTSASTCQPHSLTIASTGTLNIQGSGNKVFRYSGGTIYNYGNIYWTGTGPIIGASNSINIQTGGTFTAQNDASVLYDGGGGSNITINNAGTFIKADGNGNTSLEQAYLNNSGTVQVNSGNLIIEKGTQTGSFTISSGCTLTVGGSGFYNCSFDEGCSINGSGTFNITSGRASFTGTTNGSTISSSTTVNCTGGKIDGDGKVTIDGTFNHSSSDQFSVRNFIISSSGIFNITGSNNKSFRYGPDYIHNYGTINWIGSGNINGADYVIYNYSSGIFDIQTDAGMYSDGGGGSSYQIYNSGIIKKTAGTGTFYFYYVDLKSNSGTIKVETGTLEFSRDLDASIFSSNTLSTGTYYINGTLKIKNLSVQTNNANITLYGASSALVNHSGTNSLASLSSIGASGSLTLRNGRDFSTSASTFTNNGTLDCGANIFSGSGNFVNASGSTLILGSVDGITSAGTSSGNIQNTGTTRTFSNTANYKYNATVAQVTGNGLPSTVDNLEIDNSNGVTLTNSTTVNGVLTLTSGNVTTGSNTLLIGSSGSVSRTSGHIIGNFQKYIQTGATSKTFEIGTANSYSPVSVQFGNVSVDGNLTAAAFQTTHPNAATPNETLNRYWSITNSGVTFDNYSATFYYSSGDFNNVQFVETTDEATMKVGKYDGSWTFPTIGTRNTAGNSIEITGLTGFSSFTISKDEAALPVEITTFTASVENSKVNLNWTTATEVNNFGFEIERAIENGKLQIDNWEKIGFVAGHGNSNSPKDYSFIDDISALSLSKCKYRLKQIDFDGKYEYSEEVEVTIDLPTKFALEQNYPNPFNPITTIKYSIPSVMVRQAHHDNVTLSSSKSDIEVTLKVYDILGREVATLVNEKQSPGNYEVKFDGSNLSSGIYFYKLEAGNFNSTKKLLLLK